METTSRIRVAMEGLGRIWDDAFAITAMDLPGVNPEEMVERLKQYQIRQAQTVAEAQKAGQEIQGGQQQDPATKAIPPMGSPGQPVQPSFGEMMAAAGQRGQA
jgi:hypothetical protein